MIEYLSNKIGFKRQDKIWHFNVKIFKKRFKIFIEKCYMSKFKDCVSKCGDLFPTQFLKFKAKIKSLMQK